jgi:NAD+ kinase
MEGKDAVSGGGIRWEIVPAERRRLPFSLFFIIISLLMLKIFLVVADNLSVGDKMGEYLAADFTACSRPEEAELILVCGGDGTMLAAVRKYSRLGIPFFGVNYGHLGFLMNRAETGTLDELARGRTEAIAVRLLEARTFGAAGQPLDIRHSFADFYFERSSPQTAKIRIAIDGKIRFDSLVCDGAIVCNSVGSTAYNASAGGMILPIDVEGMVLTGISPAIFHHWRTAQLSAGSEITLEALAADRRPVRFLSDGIEVPGVARAAIRLSDRKVSMLFVASHNFREKVLGVQFHDYARE